MNNKELGEKFHNYMQNIYTSMYANTYYDESDSLIPEKMKNFSFKKQIEKRPQEKVDMSTRREFNLSAYCGENTVAYITSKGNVVTKDALWQAFKQVAAVFGWELEGKITDRDHPNNSRSY